MEVEEINRLIKRIAKNDEEALVELFDGTKRQLYYLAKKYLQNKNDAEDVLSVAYLKIYQNSKKYNEKYNGFNWIHEIVKNTAYDFNRKEARRIEVVEYDDQTYRKEEESLSKAKVEEIHEALKVLDKKEYKVIQLKIWENETLTEIANELKMSVTTTFRVYIKALAKLKNELE